MALSSNQLLDKIRVALNARGPSSKESACRIFDSVGDGVANLSIDRYETLLIAHILETDRNVSADLSLQLAEIGAELLTLTNTSALYEYRHTGEEGAKKASQATLIAGYACLATTVIESDLRFLIRPAAQCNVGLFLDTQPLRAWLRTLKLAGRVLNCFAYTGTLGIAAAAAGAQEIIQLDASRQALEWAKENATLNQELFIQSGRAPPNFRYIREHVQSFCEKELRRIASATSARTAYELIIIDAPTYGRAKEGDFQIERDLPTLIDLALALLKADGIFVLSCNFRRLTPAALWLEIQNVAKEHGFRCRKLMEIVPDPIQFSSAYDQVSHVRGVIVKKEPNL